MTSRNRLQSTYLRYDVLGIMIDLQRKANPSTIFGKRVFNKSVPIKRRDIIAALPSHWIKEGQFWINRLNSVIAGLTKNELIKNSSWGEYEITKAGFDKFVDEKTMHPNLLTGTHANANTIWRHDAIRKGFIVDSLTDYLLCIREELWSYKGYLAYTSVPFYDYAVKSKLEYYSAVKKHQPPQLRK